MAPGRMSERVVNKYLRYATDDMIQNNRTEIRCPCRKCKKVGLLNPFSGELLEHLLIHGFMDGHIQWLDEDDDGAADDHDQHEMIKSKKTKSRLMILPHMMLEI